MVPLIHTQEVRGSGVPARPPSFQKKTYLHRAPRINLRFCLDCVRTVPKPVPMGPTVPKRQSGAMVKTVMDLPISANGRDVGECTLYCRDA